MKFQNASSILLDHQATMTPERLARYQRRIDEGYDLEGSPKWRVYRHLLQSSSQPPANTPVSTAPSNVSFTGACNLHSTELLHRRYFPGPSELQTLHARPLIHPVPLKFGGIGTLSEGTGESACTLVRFVDPVASDLYGKITSFGEAGLLEARKGRAINACVLSKVQSASNCINLT